MPSTSGNAVGQKRRRSARVRGLAHGAITQRAASAPTHVDVEDPELRSREERDGDRREDGELAQSTVGRSSASTIA